MGLSFFHVLVVLIVVLIVFGAGRLPQVMGDLGKGIRNFKSGLNGDPLEGTDQSMAASQDTAKTLPPTDKKPDGQA